MRFVWDGGGLGLFDWTTPANWVGDIAPSAGDDLVFPANTVNKLSHNNFPAGTLFNSFEINSNNYTISGSDIQLAHGIESNAPSPGPNETASRVALRLTLTNAQTFESDGFFGIAQIGAVDMGANLLTVVTSFFAFVEIDGPVSGSAGITKNGAGTFDLFGSNSYSGPTLINTGTLAVGNDNALGATGPGNDTTVNSGGTLLLEFGLSVPEDITATGNGALANGAIFNPTNDNTLTGAITLIGDVTINVPNSANTLTISGSIGDNGSPTDPIKRGQGTLVFSNANSYRGKTTVSDGILRILDSGSLGATGGATAEVQTVTIGGASSGTFSLTSNGQTTPPLSATATAAEVEAALNALPSIFGAGGSVTVSQSGNSYTVTFGGSFLGYNQTQLVGAGSGGTTVDVTTLVDGGDNGTFVGGTLQVQNSITVGDALTLDGPGFTPAGGTPLGTLDSTSGANTWTGDILLIGDTSIAVDSGSLELSGAISEVPAAGANLTKVGAGTLILSGSNSNTYTGTTFVNAGILQLNKSGNATAINGNLQIADLTSVPTLGPDQISDTSIVSIFGTGLFDVPFAETIGALNMTRGQVNAAAGLRVSTGQITATSDASGFAASIAGILDLGGVTNVVTVNDGLGPVDLDISATITSGGFGGLQKEGPGTLQLSGSSSNTYSGTTFVNAGTLVLNKSPGADAIPATFVIGLFSGVQTVLLLAPDQIADTAQVQIFPSGGFGLNGFDDTIGSLQLHSGAGTASAVATGAGTLSLAGNLTLFADSGSDTGATIFGNLNLLPGSHTFNIADGAAANDLDISAAIGGAGDLIKTGPGTLVFSGSSANSYTGTTFVNQGTLSLARTGGAVAIAGGLTVQGGTAIETFGDQIADTAPLSVANGGTFDLNNLQDTVGAVNSAGLMKIRTGTLSAASFALASTSILAIDLNPGGNPGHINVAGALTLGGTVQFSAATSVPNGTVRFIIDGATPTTGQFSNFAQGSIQNIGGSTYRIDYFANGGAEVILTAVNPAAGSISGTVFTDLNGNGQTNGDPGLNGITVQLDLGADGTIDQTATTANGGQYSFGNLPVGLVRIRIVVPAGSIQTTPNPADINLAFGQTVTNVNFGVFQLISVSGVKFNDFNGDGIQNIGEVGVGGVTIVLTNVGVGAPPRTITTNANGTFSFTNVGPGAYRVTETPPAGTFQTTPNPAAFSVVSGTNVGGLTFGNRKKPTELFAVGAGQGGFPQVKVFNANGTLRFSFFAYAAGFSGGVQVATGDVNGDGIDDIITGAGPGGGPHVKVFSGANLALLDSFFAYGTNFTGGVFVAAGDVNRDGFADIVTGAGPSGGPHVEVFSGRNLALLRSFFAYGAAFNGGVRVGAGDVNHDGFADIITGAGEGGGPHVEVFNGKNLALLQSFLAFGSGFTGGVFVAGGDVDGDGFADVVVGQGPGSQPEVRIYSGRTGALHSHFIVYDQFFRGGVRVAVADIDGNGKADVLTGAGFIGGPHVKAIDVASLFEFHSFFAFDPSFLGGVFVG
jgi:autotransporter-associated beta strand protein